MIDLHCHSHYSDGALSPKELLNRAITAGVKVLALTDHDTIAGLAELHQAAVDHDIAIINGIELSVRWKKYDIHILGLQIVLDNELLSSLIEKQNDSRILRAVQIGKRLEDIGVLNAYKKACDIAGHERVGRPHYAALLVNEGLAFDMKTAFKRFLVTGKIAFVPTPWVNLEEAILAIKSAGGQAVIAHPLKYSLTRLKLHELINTFKLFGGEGIEVISSDIAIPDIDRMVAICQRFELLASSGSDYHSDTASRVKLGKQRQLPTNCTPIWQQWNI